MYDGARRDHLSYAVPVGRRDENQSRAADRCSCASYRVNGARETGGVWVPSPTLRPSGLSLLRGADRAEGARPRLLRVSPRASRRAPLRSRAPRLASARARDGGRLFLQPDRGPWLPPRAPRVEHARDEQEGPRERLPPRRGRVRERCRGRLRGGRRARGRARAARDRGRPRRAPRVPRVASLPPGPRRGVRGREGSRVVAPRAPRRGGGGDPLRPRRDVRGVERGRPQARHRGRARARCGVAPGPVEAQADAGGARGRFRPRRRREDHPRRRAAAGGRPAERRGRVFGRRLGTQVRRREETRPREGVSRLRRLRRLGRRLRRLGSIFLLLRRLRRRRPRRRVPRGRPRGERRALRARLPLRRVPPPRRSRRPRHDRRRRRLIVARVRPGGRRRRKRRRGTNETRGRVAPFRRVQAPVRGRRQGDVGGPRRVGGDERTRPELFRARVRPPERGELRPLGEGGSRERRRRRFGFAAGAAARVRRVRRRQHDARVRPEGRSRGSLPPNRRGGRTPEEEGTNPRRRRVFGFRRRLFFRGRGFGRGGFAGGPRVLDSARGRRLGRARARGVALGLGLVRPARARARRGDDARRERGGRVGPGGGVRLRPRAALG